MTHFTCLLPITWLLLFFGYTSLTWPVPLNFPVYLDLSRPVVVDSDCYLLHLPSLSLGTFHFKFLCRRGALLCCQSVWFRYGRPYYPDSGVTQVRPGGCHATLWTAMDPHLTAQTRALLEPWPWEALSPWGGYFGRMWAWSWQALPKQMAYLEVRQTEPMRVWGESWCETDVVWAVESHWPQSRSPSSFSRWSNIVPFLLKLMWVWFQLVSTKTAWSIRTIFFYEESACFKWISFCSETNLECLSTCTEFKGI